MALSTIGVLFPVFTYSFAGFDSPEIPLTLVVPDVMFLRVGRDLFPHFQNSVERRSETRILRRLLGFREAVERHEFSLFRVRDTSGVGA